MTERTTILNRGRALGVAGRKRLLICTVEEQLDVQKGIKMKVFVAKRPKE